MTKAINSIFKVALCALIAFGAASCSDDDDNNFTDNPPVNGNPGTEEKSDESAEAYYKGDIYDAGTGNLWVTITKGITYDVAKDDYTGTGYILCVDFNTTLAENPDFATITAGEYTGSTDEESHAMYTLNLADGESYLNEYTNGEMAAYEFSDGKATVSMTGSTYTISFNLTTTTGEIKEFTYQGAITPINLTGEGQMSNLTSSVSLSDMTQAATFLYGETFTETSDHAIMVIAGPDFDLESNYGNSPSLMLGFNITPGAEAVPEGDYTVINAEEADDYETFTLLSGVYDPAYGGFMGSWYFNAAKSLQAAMKKGTVSVKHNTDGTYTVSVDLSDGYNNTVKGTYTGKMRIAVGE